MILTYDDANDSDEDERSTSSNGRKSKVLQSFLAKSRGSSAPHKNDLSLHKVKSKKNDESQSYEEEFCENFNQMQIKSKEIIQKQRRSSKGCIVSIKNNTNATVSENESIIGKEGNYLNKDIMRMINEDSLAASTLEMKEKARKKSHSVPLKSPMVQWKKIIKKIKKKKGKDKEINDSATCSVEVSSLSKSTLGEGLNHSLDLCSPKWRKNFLLKTEVCKNANEFLDLKNKGGNLLREENPILQYYGRDLSPIPTQEKNINRDKILQFDISPYLMVDNLKKNLGQAFKKDQLTTREEPTLSQNLINRNKIQSICSALKKEVIVESNAPIHEEIQWNTNLINSPQFNSKISTDNTFSQKNFDEKLCTAQVSSLMSRGEKRFNRGPFTWKFNSNEVEEPFQQGQGKMNSNDNNSIVENENTVYSLKNNNCNYNSYNMQNFANADNSMSNSNKDIYTINSFLEPKNLQVQNNNSVKIASNYNMNLLTANKPITNHNNNILFNDKPITRTPSKARVKDYTELDDIELAQVASLVIRDQSGCRFVQKKISNDPVFANQVLFYYIQKDILELIFDSFGNYLIQKLIDILDLDKLELIENLICLNFFEIAVSPHGTRVIQKIIEKIEISDILFNKFNQAFSESLVEISKNSNANHIVQKYVYTVKYPKNQFVYDIMVSHFWKIAVDKHGCCAMQKCIDAGTKEQRAVLINIVINNAMKLITEQFGNYVIQFILSLNDPAFNNHFICLCLPFLSKLCKQKYSSNVIEKSFDHCTIEVQQLLVNELLKSEQLVIDLLLDPYGNYIIQKALTVAKDNNYFQLLQIVACNIGKLRQVSFGSKLIAKLTSNYKDLSMILKSNSNSVNSANPIGYLNPQTKMSMNRQNCAKMGKSTQPSIEQFPSNVWGYSGLTQGLNCNSYYPSPNYRQSNFFDESENFVNVNMKSNVNMGINQNIYQINNQNFFPCSTGNSMPMNLSRMPGCGYGTDLMGNPQLWDNANFANQMNMNIKINPIGNNMGTIENINTMCSMGNNSMTPKNPLLNMNMNNSVNNNNSMGGTMKNCTLNYEKINAYPYLSDYRFNKQNY